MQPNQFSKTAIGVASVRAHHHENDHPLVFDDPYAGILLDETDRARALGYSLALVSNADRSRAEGIDDPVVRKGALMRANPFTGSILVTYRLADEWLRKAIVEGIEQCVVLGAGLDSTSLRFANHAGPLRILEVDHPTTQLHKRHRIAEQGLSPRPGTEFVAVDFDTTDLTTELGASSYLVDRPALFNWLGVIYFLNADAVLHVFETIHRMSAPGSIVVFDIYESGTERPTEERDADVRMASLVGALGEPHVKGLSAESLMSSLRAMGYIELDLVRPEEVEPWHRTARGLGYSFISGSWIARVRR